MQIDYTKIKVTCVRCGNTHKQDVVCNCNKRLQANGTIYNLKKDHANIKKQIKEWEKQIDKLINEDVDNQEGINILENLSHEMMAINM